jgi:hypothetical protein
MRLDAILPDRLKEHLTPAEQRLLECIANDEEADFSAPDENQNDPTQWAAWGPERTIRSALLFWLCTDQQAAACIPPKGIRIRGARIEGRLDFEGATLAHRLSLIRCAIPEGIVLTDARARRIDLSDSYTQGLYASGLTTEGDLVLSGLICVGAVQLVRAHIKGQLVCHRVRLENPNGDALFADWMTVEGAAVLDEGFHATGEVRLPGTHIKGQLSCRGARLENPNGNALFADGMTVEESVFLDEGFHATGMVRLTGAHIWSLSCRNARFENPNGVALNLEYARIRVLVDDEGSWPQQGRLRIDGLEYEGFAGDPTPMDAQRRLEWLRRQLPHFRPQPYDQLARVFRRMGWEAEAVEVLIAKQKDLIRYGKLSWWGKLTRRILGVTIGYGYRPRRAFFWGLAFVIAGGLIFKWAYTHDLMVPVKILTDPLYRESGTIPTGYPRFQDWAYSLDVFLPIVDLHQESFWLPDAGKPWGATLWLYLRLHILAGWVFSTLFVSGVTGLVKSRLE